MDVGQVLMLVLLAAVGLGLYLVHRDTRLPALLALCVLPPTVVAACAHMQPPTHVQSSVTATAQKDGHHLVTERSCWAFAGWLLCETVDLVTSEGTPRQACLLVRPLDAPVGAGFEVCAGQLGDVDQVDQVDDDGAG